MFISAVELDTYREYRFGQNNRTPIPASRVEPIMNSFASQQFCTEKSLYTRNIAGNLIIE
jgi:hypothetical protein